MFNHIHKFILVLTVFVSAFFVKSDVLLNNEKHNDISNDNVELKEEVKKDNVDQEELKTQNEEVPKDSDPIKDTQTSTSTTSTTTNNESSSKNITDNKINQNNVTTNQDVSTSKNETVVNEDKPKENTTPTTNNSEVNTYIGVPNPNDFYYSFHHGKIEYSSMDKCLENVPNIALKDTVDIVNTWCIDVVDGKGTILGQYLYINCKSGNCDKYK